MAYLFKKFEYPLFISVEEINLSRQKQSYRFYLFDKSWNFSVKHVIYNNNNNSSSDMSLH